VPEPPLTPFTTLPVEAPRLITRSLPQLLKRELELARTGYLRLAIGEVIDVPDDTHVRVEFAVGGQAVVPCVGFAPVPGGAVYCLAADTILIAIGQVGQGPIGISIVSYKPFDYQVVANAGEQVLVISSGPVMCEAGPIEVEFYAPFLSYNHVRFALTVDAAQVGDLGRYHYPLNDTLRVPVSLRAQLDVTAGQHTFNLDMQAIGSYSALIGGGVVGVDTYTKGFLRISKLVTVT
jgi:hypothetical protein